MDKRWCVWEKRERREGEWWMWIGTSEGSYRWHYTWSTGTEIVWGKNNSVLTGWEEKELTPVISKRLRKHSMYSGLKKQEWGGWDHQTKKIEFKGKWKKQIIFEFPFCVKTVGQYMYIIFFFGRILTITHSPHSIKSYCLHVLGDRCIKWISFFFLFTMD